jgi:hypothetical protein
VSYQLPNEKESDMIAYIPFIVAVVALLVFAFSSSNTKVSHVSLISYGCAFLALMFQLAGRTFKLFSILAPVVIMGILS